jgi:hypothetical protein
MALGQNNFTLYTAILQALFGKRNPFYVTFDNIRYQIRVLLKLGKTLKLARKSLVVSENSFEQMKIIVNQQAPASQPLGHRFDRVR